MDCDIYSLPLFSGGDKELINNILQENPARHRLYAKGDIIALQGYVCKQLYLLCSGSAYARMVSEEGKEFTLDTLSAPEVLASAFLFSTEGIFPVTIIAASDCSIWLISREAMLRILKADQTVMQNYLRVISDHSMFLSNRRTTARYPTCRRPPSSSASPARPSPEPSPSSSHRAPSSRPPRATPSPPDRKTKRSTKPDTINKTKKHTAMTGDKYGI